MHALDGATCPALTEGLKEAPVTGPADPARQTDRARPGGPADGGGQGDPATAGNRTAPPDGCTACQCGHRETGRIKGGHCSRASCPDYLHACAAAAHSLRGPS